MQIRSISFLVCLVVAPCFLGGCQSTSIALKEAFGYEKREQLVDRVQDARDDQVEAKAQFQSALEEFLIVTEVGATDLEARYESLSDAYEQSVDEADDVRGRISDVERVAEALFREWEAELEEYSSEDLRRSSSDQLNTTRTRYRQLLGAMQNAADSMTPVLSAFKDQVLYLKHHLNAAAIAALQDKVVALETDVSRLVREMETSIAEANRFIEQMRTP